ncbi:hypothetical protein CE91St44_23140 [Oscillospiraceae bacterium]|nr:hypothetical protein CE91St44_23140 [Oscillospiraceae bacterium]
MGMLYRLCIWLSVGIVLGFLGGGVKWAAKKNYTEKQLKAAQKLRRRAAFGLKYLTLLLLVLGFVWCVYFLILGIAAPGQAEYANNMSELIVAVLTVISIIFAFFEFLSRSSDEK